MTVKKFIVIFIILGLAATVVLYFITKGEPAATYTTVKAERTSIIQTVSEVGTVKASKEIDLNFLNSGRVNKLNVKIGDTVKAEQVLAELDYSSLSISKKELEANLDVTRSNYNKLLAGASEEEISIAKASEQQAKAAYEAAQNELVKIKGAVLESINQAQKTLSDLENSTNADITTYEQAINTAKTNLDNAISTYGRIIENLKESALNVVEDKLALANTTLDIIDRTITDEDGEDLISVKNLTYLDTTKKEYKEAQNLLINTESVLAVTKANNNNDNYNLLLDNALATLNKVFDALQSCFSALENSITSSSFTLTELNTLKASISTEKTTTAAAINSLQTTYQNLNDSILNYDTNVSAAEEALRQAEVAYDNTLTSARNALATAQVNGEQQIAAGESRVRAAAEAYQVAKAQLNKILASADQNDIALAQAQIRQAQAALDAMNKKIEDSIIKAPIDGTITEVNYEVGEQLKAGLSAIKMLAENNYEIGVLISEADISKIQKGQNCEISLDAFGEDVIFLGSINFIEPAETEVQDVVYYKITIVFDPREESVKSGMTANINITTANRNNVLVIPSRAILNKGSEGKFARVLVDGVLTEKKIATGLSGDGGLVEVISGINEGELVVTYINE